MAQDFAYTLRQIRGKMGRHTFANFNFEQQKYQLFPNEKTCLRKVNFRHQIPVNYPLRFF